MIPFLPRRGREGKTRQRPSTRRFQAEVDALEGRQLLTFSIKTVQVTPQVLWPPDGQFVPVQISGTAIEFHYNGSRVTFHEEPGPKIGQFHVTDEYRQNNPTGIFTPVHVTANRFTFSFTVDLQAKRSTEFPQGRRYYVAIGMEDADGWAGKTVAVWVPKSLPPGFASTATAALSRAKT
ncbi:MAG: hypothetical protein P4L84_32575 [Isosphaeraceae bacterium]|nr:hypothetical protein [Isosphaeraceae bacterium]